MNHVPDLFVVSALSALLVGCASGGSGVKADGGTTSTTSSTTTTSSLDLDGSVPDGGDAGPCAEATFELSETQEVFTVPANARYMQVKAWGAGGNGEGQCTLPQDDGGLGGFSGGVFEVTPGMPLIVIVGKRGRAGLTAEDIVKFGFGHWGGGGLSGVFHGPELITENDRDKALVIAGGGGGASAPGCNPAGTGNHPDAGGQATLMGGHGADDVNGGAGGYEGGIGGTHGLPGKGGSGFVAATATDPVILYSEPGTAAPPKTDDPDYAADVGGVEQSGRVVLNFVCGVPPPM